MNALIAELEELLGERHVLTAADDVSPFCRDWRGRYAGSALCVAFLGKGSLGRTTPIICLMPGIVKIHGASKPRQPASTQK